MIKQIILFSKQDNRLKESEIVIVGRTIVKKTNQCKDLGVVINSHPNIKHK